MDYNEMYDDGEGIMCSQQLSDPFKSMCLASQQALGGQDEEPTTMQQVKAPVPLFGTVKKTTKVVGSQQGWSQSYMVRRKGVPLHVGGSQADCVADLGIPSQDFITPADQFDVDIVSQRRQQGAAAVTMIRQRSPAMLSPCLKMKRARARSPSNRAFGSNVTEDGLENVCPACGGAGNGGAGNGGAGNGGAGNGGAGNKMTHAVVQKRDDGYKVKRNALPPCYRSIFSGNSDEEVCLMAWRGQEATMMSAHPKVQMAYIPGSGTGSRYRDEFKEVGMLGQGAFSKVYSARHRLDGKSYAIKRSLRGVKRHSAEFAHFLQEVQILSNVPQHKGIVRYYGCWTEACVDVENDGEKLYMQLELGTSTLKNLALGEPMPEGALVQVGRQVLSALDHLHQCGIAHMDIKPSNILIVRRDIDNDGGDDRSYLDLQDGEVKLADFGQAAPCRTLPGHATQQCRVQEGDSRYLPLEVMNSDYSQLDKADIFSLGAMLFELATGNELPSGGSAYEDLRRGRVPLLPGITNSLMQCIRQMLKFDPIQRPSAAKLLTMNPFASC